MHFLKKRSVKIILVLVAIFASSIGSAYAGASLEPVKGFFNHGVSFVLNGDLWQPKDPNGKKLTAIYYDGSNYLPVRALSEALKVPIEFDADNQKIYIGGKPGEKTPIFAMPMDIDDIYVTATRDPQETLVNNNQYKQVLKIDQYGDITFTVDRKYKRLVLDAAVVSPGEHEVEFTLYNVSDLEGNDKDVVLQLQKVSPEDTSKQLVFNIEGLDKIKIHVQSHNLNPYIYARVMDTSFFDNGETALSDGSTDVIVK